MAPRLAYYVDRPACTAHRPKRPMHATEVVGSVGMAVAAVAHTDHVWSASRLGARQSIMPWFATLSVSPSPTPTLQEHIGRRFPLPPHHVCESLLRALRCRVKSCDPEIPCGSSVHCRRKELGDPGSGPQPQRHPPRRIYPTLPTRRKSSL